MTGLSLIIAAGIYMLVIFIKDRGSKNVMQEIRSVSQQAEPSETTYEAPVSTDPAQQVGAYAPLFDMNPDMAGWLTIPGTKVDYPIMHTPDDEEHYLYKNFYDKPDRNGCLVLSAHCDMEKPSVNLLIHGHNMRNGEMFGGLSKYRDKAYRDDHNEILLYTKDELRTYNVVGAADAKILDRDENGFLYYGFFDTSRQEELDHFIEEANIYNLYDDSQITASLFDNDQLLCLSTCRGFTGGPLRFVLICKRVS